MSTRQDIASAILNRRDKRRSFESWCNYRMAKVDRAPAAHHLLIIRAIEQLVRGELPGNKTKLMLLLPPGSAKSTYTSVELPAWFLNVEQHPHDLVLACSYSYSLVEGFGRRARDILKDEKNILGVTLSETAAASGDWRVTSRGRSDGGYFCAGVGAGITGHRAKLGVIDDYHGNQQEADSKQMRDKVYNWYRADFLPRLLPESYQIIIANRRHEDDLVGRLQREEPSEWHIIEIPMLAEKNKPDPLGRQPGERLWPEWFTETQVNDAKKDPRVWACLYQQRPAPEEGAFFKSEWITTYSLADLPPLDSLRIYAASDWAVKKRSVNDLHCHLIGGVDSSGRLWILPDWFWERADTMEAMNAMFRLARKYHPVTWWQGKENITGTLGPFMYARMRETGTFFPVEELSESKDKVSKAASIKGWFNARMVMLPGFAPDYDQLYSQLLTFPGGVHDDFVDAIAKFGLGLDRMAHGSRPAASWDGIVQSSPPITMDWLRRSSRRRESHLDSILSVN